MKPQVTGPLPFLPILLVALVLVSRPGLAIASADPDPASRFADLLNLAQAEEQKGNWNAARDAYARALEWGHRSLDARTKRWGEKHPDVADAMDHLATAYLDRQRLLTTVGWEERPDDRQCCDFVLVYQQAEWIWTQHYATPFHPRVAETLDRTARLWDACHPPMAEKYYQAAISLREKISGEDHTAVADALDRYGRYLQHAMMKFKEARTLYLRAYRIRQGRFGAADPRAVVNLADLARVSFYGGDKAGAGKWVQHALQALGTTGNKGSCDAPGLLHSLGLLESEMGNPARADDLLARALERVGTCSGATWPHPGDIHLDLARVARDDHRPDQALGHFQAALKMGETRYGQRHPALEAVLVEMIALLEEQGDTDRVRALNIRYQKVLKH